MAIAYPSQSVTIVARIMREQPRLANAAYSSHCVGINVSEGFLRYCAPNWSKFIFFCTMSARSPLIGLSIVLLQAFHSE